MVAPPGFGCMSKDRGRYARDPLVKAAVNSAGIQEEERVNGKLVEVLERKCSKLRQKFEDEEQRRLTIEQKLEKATIELAELRLKLEQRDQQVSNLCAAQRELAEERKASAQRAMAFESAQLQRERAEQKLKQQDAELKRQREEGANVETEWKDQIVKLLAQVKSAEKRSSDMELKLGQVRAENERLTASARDLLSRYETESAQRLELEEKCISLEEKLRAKDVRIAQQKAKQGSDAKQRAEELANHHVEKAQEALKRAEDSESRCRGLQEEVRRLNLLLGERSRQLDLMQDRESGQVASVIPASRLPAPPRPSSASRPVTATSASSAPIRANGSTTAPPTNQRCFSEDRSVARLPPGAIRRAGSVPTSGACGVGVQRVVRYVQLPQHRHQEQPTNLPLQHPLQKEVRTAASEVKTPSKVATKIIPPESRDDEWAHQLAEPQIDDTIPSESDNSSDEEVLTVMQRRH